MKFEYDDQKSINNKTNHGISLEEAKTIWQSPFVEIKAKTVDETRYMAIGKINSLFYSCIYTIRTDAIRLISARRSRKSEEKIYHESIRI